MPGGPGYKHLEPGDVLVRVNGEVSLFEGNPLGGISFPFFPWFSVVMFHVNLVCISSLVKLWYMFHVKE